MSVLSYTELCTLVERGVITGVKKEQINSSSIDITLGDKILIEHRPLTKRIISLARRETPEWIYDHAMNEEGYVLEPGEFILAGSEQKFYLPNNISAEYKLKSSMARMGLEHLNAGWCDAGWNGSVLTLELKNMLRYHSIHIKPGDAIGQIVFFKHADVPNEKAYGTRGRYNKDTEVTGVKP